MSADLNRAARAAMIESALRAIIKADDNQALTQSFIESGRCALNFRAPVQAQGVALSEREQFTMWAVKDGWHPIDIEGVISGVLHNMPRLNLSWEVWQARAALDQAKPVAREVASERPTAAGNLQASGMVVKATFGDHHIIAPIGNANELPIGTKLYAQGLTDAKDLVDGYEGAKVEVDPTGLSATLHIYYVNEGCAESAKEAIERMTGNAGEGGA